MTKLAVKVCQLRGCVHAIQSSSPATVVKVLQQLGALRHPGIFEQVLLACQCDARGYAGHTEAQYLPAEYLRVARRCVSQVDVPAVVQAAQPKYIEQAIYQAQVESLANLGLCA